MKVCVIINPKAGSVENIKEIQDRLNQLGPCEVKFTRRANDATFYAQRALAKGYDYLIAVGGDGTVNEVVNGMAGYFEKAYLGIVPLGTGNDFARSINVTADLESALDVLIKGRMQEIDLGVYKTLDTRYFINAAAGGFSGMVDEILTEEMKRTWGPLAYLRSAIEVLPNFSEYQTTIRLDDNEEIQEKVFSIVISNAHYVAGGIPVAPQANLDDGLLDVMIIPETTILNLAVLVPQLLLGQHLNSSSVISRRAHNIKVESKPGMWFNVDGELISKDLATWYDHNKRWK